MFFLIGLVVVFGSFLSGYKIHGGNLSVLNQPSEFIIILGIAFGSLLIGYPFSYIKKAVFGLKHFSKVKPYTKEDYMELLLFSFNVFKLIKIKGMLEIEKHIEKPDESDIYKAAPSLQKEEFAMDFVTDHLRILTMGIDSPYQVEDLMESEIDIYKTKVGAAGDVFCNLGDSLPAIGIIAAVLGVIVTMGSILEPPDVLGRLIGAALVGTFLGIFCAYGIFGPIGHYLQKYATYQVDFISCIKIGFIAFLNENPPIVVVEFMRKNIQIDIRPTFEEVDEYINENAMKVTG